MFAICLFEQVSVCTEIPLDAKATDVMTNDSFTSKINVSERTSVASSELLYQALNGVTTAIYIKDCDQRLVFVNDACCRLFNQSRSELLQKGEADILPSAIASQLHIQDEQTLRGNSQCSTPKTIALEHPNGGYQAVTRHTEVSTDGTTILCYLDVESNASLLEDNTVPQVSLWQIPQLNTLLANVPAAIYQLYRYANGKLQFTFVSPGAYEIFGVSPEAIEADTSHVLAQIHPLDRSEFDQTLNLSAESLEFWFWEGRYYRANGKTGWLQTAARPRCLPDGSTVWNGLLMNITDRKQVEAATIEQAVMEQALADNEIRFRTITRTIPGALIQLRVRNGEYYVDFVSDRIRDIFGLAPETVMGNATTFLERIHPMDTQRFQETVQRAVMEGSPWQFEGRVFIPTQETRWWRIDSMPLPQNHDGITFCGVMLDVTASKMIEEAYRENERQLRLALNVSGMGFWTWDMATDQMVWKTEPGTLFDNTAITYCNTFETYLQNVHLEDRPTVKMAISQALKAGQDYQIEYRLLLGDLDICWVCERGGLWRDPDGFVLGLMGTVVDITNRKDANAALRDSEERNRTLINNIPGAVYRRKADEKWTLLFQSDAILEILGYPPGHPIYQEDWKLIHPGDRVRVKEEIVEAISQKHSFESEYRILHADGTVRWIVETGQPVLDSAGTVQFIDGVLTDITRRKESENRSQELARRESLINRISTQIRDSLELIPILQTTVQAVRCQLETDRVVVYRCESNQTGEIVVEDFHPEWPSVLHKVDVGCCFIEKLPTQAATTTTLAIDNIYDGNLNDRTIQYLEDLQVKGILVAPIFLKKKRWGVLMAHECKAPRSWKSHEIELMTALSGQAGLAIGQADLYRQATENAAHARQQAKDLEAALIELQQTQAKLVQTEKMSSLGQLVAGVAHEINNPVSFIDGNILHASEYTQDLLKLTAHYRAMYPHPPETLARLIEEVDLDFLAQDFPKLLESMRIGAERIKKIVTSLRTFSRMDEAEIKAVNIHDGLDSTVMILQHRLKSNGDRPHIRLSRRYGQLPLVECYAGKLNQVFMNLISNAVDAIEEHIDSDQFTQPPEISITTQYLPSDKAQITIADNGPGISPENRKRIFEPFYTTKPVGKGTGIGLSISYQIVTESHLGTLECDSELGEGTQFHITIPVQQGIT